MVKVITYGTFDLFHEGHYRLLQRAKQLGDYLIVGVTTEEYDRTRGKLNVIDSLLTRMENVKNTGFADEVISEESVGQKINDIKKYNIDKFAIGSDWLGAFDYIKDYCEVVYLERTKNISSTMLRSKLVPIQRIGIIGTGRIANRFVPEARAVSGVSTQCVYNPDYASAKAFAERWVLNAHEDIEEFYASSDIVYIASPHETHYGYIRQALEYEKHVLCEKPMGLSLAETEEVFSLAKEKGRILFEGIKTAYCPGFTKLMGVACSGVIGNIRSIEATFTKLENKNTREMTDAKYGGSFTEMGSYCMLPIIKLFGHDCEVITFETIKDENGIDMFTKAHFRYANGLATATCGLGVKSEGKLLICGTKGYIVVEPPWWKTTYFEVHHEDPNEVERYTERFLGDGLRYEICDMLSALNGDTKKDFKLTRKDSEVMVGVMEQFLREQGRV